MRKSGSICLSDHMGPEAARVVEQEALEALAATSVDRVKTNVIYAVARRAAPGQILCVQTRT